MGTTSVKQVVIATVERTNATGAIVPPAAGTVPTADGAGAVWAPGGAGGRVATRFNADQDQVLYDDGVTRFLWSAAEHQVAFQTNASPWLGSERFGRWMSFAALEEMPVALVTTGSSIPITSDPLYISSGYIAPDLSYRQLPGFSASIVHWAIWPTAGDAFGASLFEGTIAMAVGAMASAVITRSV